MSDENPCMECDGICCSFEDMQIAYIGLEKGQRYDSAMLNHSNLENLLLQDGSVPDMEFLIKTNEVQSEDGDSYQERSIVFDCKHRVDGKCTVYDKRPSMCQHFECPALDEDDEMELDEFVAEYEQNESREEMELRDVTDRVRQIIADHAEFDNE